MYAARFAALATGALSTLTAPGCPSPPVRGADSLFSVEAMSWLLLASKSLVRKGAQTCLSMRYEVWVSV